MKSKSEILLELGLYDSKNISIASIKTAMEQYAIQFKSEWNNATIILPLAHDINEPGADNYFVQTNEFGKLIAMYIQDNNGKRGWYTTYYSRLVIPVLKWKI